MSTDRTAPLRRLGATIGFTQARNLASELTGGRSLRGALDSLGGANAQEVRQAVTDAGYGPEDTEELQRVLHALAGAEAHATVVTPVWTMPDQLATSGRATRTLPEVVASASISVTCATYNFQESSGLVEALREVCRRGGVDVRVFMDTRAADHASEPRHGSPSTEEVAGLLKGAAVHRTRKRGGYYVRTHAKFVVVDHRLVYVTSANFSRSAEEYNVELGLLADDSALATSLERQLQSVVGEIYERLAPT